MENKIIFRSQPLHYLTEGNGFPVVLLHGFGEDSSIWALQTEYLKKEFRMIIPDIPGSGASPFNPELFSISDFAGLIEAILKAEMINEFILIAHSMGGYISLAFAGNQGARLKGLGLFHSTAFADSEEKKAARKKSIEFINAHGSAAFIRQTIPNLFAAETKEKRPELVEAIIQKYSDFEPAALITYYEAMINRPDTTNLLGKLTVPILWIMGEEDKAVPMNDGLRQTHLSAESIIHILKNTAHMGMLEKPEAANRFLEDYIRLAMQKKST